METLNESNSSITVANTKVTLVEGPSCPAQVVLRLSPTPTIHFELLDPSPELHVSLFEALMEDEPITIKLPSGKEVEVLYGEQSLIPITEPVSGLDTGDPLHTVRFGLINFPDFMKPRSSDSRSEAVTPWSIDDLWTIDLNGGAWSVKVRPVDNREQVHKRLRQKRGFALTHWGTVTRIDGKPFSKDSVQQLLKALNQFLSFARGVSCGMTLIKGLDDSGGTVWEEWGVTKVQQWNGHRSCLDIRHGATLEDLFAGFWRYSRSLPQDSRTYPALEWYLESNAQDASHTSIVLNQAALERLTVEIVGERKRVKTAAKMKEEMQGDWIARALRKAHVDVGVSTPFREAFETKTFEHGPHALINLRNDLIHYEMKDGIPSSAAQRMARELGLWYAELLLLKLFGYNGQYSNRLTRKWTGEVETVPWASPS